MDENTPISVSAAASDHTPEVSAINSPETPMPRKKTTIIARRPQRSPSRPAGSEPRPNMTKAPAVYGIRSCQIIPQSAAMAPTAVAKISRKRWSSAWPALRSKAVGLPVDMAGILPHHGTYLSSRPLPSAGVPPSRRLGPRQLRRDDGRERRPRLAHPRADELAAPRRRGVRDADAPTVLRRRAGGRAGRPRSPPPPARAERRRPGAHRLRARRAHAARRRESRARAAADAGGGDVARPRARGAAGLHARRGRRRRARAGHGRVGRRHARGLARGLARRRRDHRALRLGRRIPRGRRRLSRGRAPAARRVE